MDPVDPMQFKSRGGVNCLTTGLSQDELLSLTSIAPRLTYCEGQLIWLYTRDISLKIDCRKLAPRFIGAYSIVKIIGRAAVPLKLPSTLPPSCPTHLPRLQD